MLRLAFISRLTFFSVNFECVVAGVVLWCAGRARLFQFGAGGKENFVRRQQDA